MAVTILIRCQIILSFCFIFSFRRKNIIRGKETAFVFISAKDINNSRVKYCPNADISSRFLWSSWSKLAFLLLTIFPANALILKYDIYSSSTECDLLSVECYKMLLDLMDIHFKLLPCGTKFSFSVEIL